MGLQSWLVTLTVQSPEGKEITVQGEGLVFPSALRRAKAAAEIQIRQWAEK